MDVPELNLNRFNCCFKYNQFVEDFYKYNDSTFFYTSGAEH